MNVKTDNETLLKKKRALQKMENSMWNNPSRYNHYTAAARYDARYAKLVQQIQYIEQAQRKG